ncbi:MAG: hypothetical protein RML32_03570 [Gammaproteobacteria bacterium]|nr:hypothetical protein [Gammaproteobacteria bacterium]
MHGWLVREFGDIDVLRWSDLPDPVPAPGQVLFDAPHLLPMPENLDFVQAAAIPVGWLTAWHALHTVAGADTGPGKRVLIEAVGSSVGSAALQIARWRGCWVAGTASRDTKCRQALATVLPMSDLPRAHRMIGERAHYGKIVLVNERSD